MSKRYSTMDYGNAMHLEPKDVHNPFDIERIAALEARLAEAQELLRLLSAWDQFHPPMTGDHAFWKGKILAYFARNSGE